MKLQNMDSEKKRVAMAVIEAVFFTMGEVVDIQALAAACELDEDTCEEVLLALRGEYELRGSGLQIIRLENGWQMCTKKEQYPALIKIASRPKRYQFTDALLETLAIVAYRQPVTRLEMERIRGVSCAHGVDRLMDLGLIEEIGRLNAPGRPMLFGTTTEFLRAFGFSSLDDLPKVDEDELRVLTTQAEAEAGPSVSVEV